MATGSHNLLQWPVGLAAAVQAFHADGRGCITKYPGSYSQSIVCVCKLKMSGAVR